MGIKYVSLEELYGHADVISLHVPLLPSTHHMVSSLIDRCFVACERLCKGECVCVCV